MITTIAILAGGQSRRMGTDKSFVSLGDRPLIAHVVEPGAERADRLERLAGEQLGEAGLGGRDGLRVTQAGHAGGGGCDGTPPG